MSCDQGAWSEEEMERLREVFVELRDSVSDVKHVVSSVAQHFPHRGINDIKSQLREAGLLQAQRRGRGQGGGAGDGDVEKSKWIGHVSFVLEGDTVEPVYSDRTNL